MSSDADIAGVTGDHRSDRSKVGRSEKFPYEGSPVVFRSFFAMRIHRCECVIMVAQQLSWRTSASVSSKKFVVLPVVRLTFRLQMCSPTERHGRSLD